MNYSFFMLQAACFAYGWKEKTPLEGHDRFRGYCHMLGMHTRYSPIRSSPYLYTFLLDSN